MEFKTIKINGKEKKIVINMAKSEIENNNDKYNDTIELKEEFETISKQKENE